ncbi:MAG: mandelate racemase/muconate lactonizing enzyme family protein [Victivallales bacterium]|nr:mandelate racemase/muconate lactonizing enzyme family protein [Victivallales bacterium]
MQSGNACFKHHRVIVKVETDEGISGAGEAPGLPGSVFETNLTIHKQIIPQTIGMDPFDLEGLLCRIRAVTPYAPHSHVNPALSAVEMALWDIIGKVCGQPLYKLMGGKVRHEVPVANYIYMYAVDNVRQMAHEADEHFQAGFRSFKLKIGRDPEEALEIVRAVREAVGPESKIRLDPNQAWSASYAVRMIRKLEQFQLEFVEQPVPRWDVGGLSEVRRKVDTPVCACELAWDHKDIFEIIRNRAADIINVDIHRAGGLSECKKQIHAAQVAGLPCGLHTSGSLGPGTAAALHLTASSVNMPLAIELIYDWFADDVIKNPFQMTAAMQVPELPGLGVELDEEKLKNYEVKEIAAGWTVRSVPVEIPSPPPRFWL